MTEPGNGRFRSESIEGHPRREGRKLRLAFSRFATGVAAVTFDAQGPRGVTVNSMTSVSMDPPLLLFSMRNQSRALPALTHRPFTVTILAADQLEVSTFFATRNGEEPEWITGGPSPRIGGGLAWFSCTPWATYPGGDHTIIVGHIDDFDSRPGDALGFNGSAYTTIALTDQRE